MPAKGGISIMDKCPYCSAETRPGDNFCLNCGNRLLPSTPSPQQAQPVLGDATLPASDEWVPPNQGMGVPASPASWANPTSLTEMNTNPEPPTLRADVPIPAAPVAQAT